MRKAVIYFCVGLSILNGEIRVANGAISVLERPDRIFVEPGSTVLSYSPRLTHRVAAIEASGS